MSHSPPARTRAITVLVAACLLATPGVGRAGEKDEKKKAEADRAIAELPEVLKPLAPRLDDIDRSEAQPWDALRDYKRQFHFFNPTPEVLRREFVTDRPDKTINPVTIDAGTLQIETDLAIATFDRRLPSNQRGVRTRPTGAGGFEGAFPNIGEQKDDFKFLFSNFRVGLTNNLEVQLFARPAQYVREFSPFGEPSTQTFGVGDTRGLLKYNLWGNEGGSTAMCLVAFLDVPSGNPGLTTRSLEGGGLAAFLWRLPNKTYVGVELGGEFRRDPFDNRYHLEIPESISVAWSWTKEVSSKVEFASVLTTDERTSWFGVLALAVLWQPADDMQFDVGINFGVTPNAPDWQPYVGFAKRF